MPKLCNCPKCGSEQQLVKNGLSKNKTQRYYCKSCKKTFILNDSPIKYLKNSEHTFRKFIGYMIDDVALSVIARNLKIDIKTAHYYRYLVFHSLLKYQDEVRLNGVILIDETFIRIQDKKYKKIREDGLDYRGLSFNQLCVITLIDLRGICIAKVSSRAMAMPNDFKRLCNINIEYVDIFVHDGNPKQKQFMNQFKCDLIDPRREQSDIYSTAYIDSFHSNLKRYLFKHSGYRIKNIQHYLNFFAYRYNQLSIAKTENQRQNIKAKSKMIEDLLSRVKDNSKTINYKTYLKDDGIIDILK